MTQEEFNRILNRFLCVAENMGEGVREADNVMFNLSVIGELQSRLMNQPIIKVYDISNVPIRCVLKTDVDDNVECAICLESFRLRQKVFKLKCNHMFHRNCCTIWLRKHGTCPLCRAYI